MIIDISYSAGASSTTVRTVRILFSPLSVKNYNNILPHIPPGSTKRCSKGTAKCRKEKLTVQCCSVSALIVAFCLGLVL